MQFQHMGLIRLHVEIYTQFMSPLVKDDESKLGKVIKGMKSLSYEKWLFSRV